jgi:hypothetical protein
MRVRTFTKFSTIALLLAACSGDPTGVNSGDELSDAEIQALLNELAASLNEVNVGVPALNNRRMDTPMPVLLSSTPIGVDAGFNQSVPCESGSLSLAGNVKGQIDDETFLGSLNMNFTWDFNACAVTLEDVTVTVDGAPEIRFDGDYTFGENEFSLAGTEKGGFSFTISDGREGSCAIDVAFSSTVNTDAGTLEASTSGEICGRSAEGFVAIGPAT